MKRFVMMAVAMSATWVAVPARADVYTVTGPEPVQTYSVCNYDALYAVNTRAKRLRSGGEVLTISGDTATVTRSPDVYLQTKHLIRHAYQSLSASGC